jgi:hypothetical protein
VRNWANDVSGTIWYQFEGPGWRSGGLLDDEQNPKPAYQALKALTDKLSGTRFSKLLTNYDRLEAYEFTSDEKTVWVLWSPDEVDIQIDLPENLSAVYDKYGQEITPDTSQITVNSPVFFELNP